MAAFLNSVATYIHEHYKDKVENLCIVLPSQRGALFLKQHLAKVYGKTIWLPTIISAEDLITEFSGLKIPEEVDLICHLYESYRICYGEGAESFEGFAKWGQLILQDFSEIDRYLAPPEQLYENLKDIKVIENWSLGEENLSAYQASYLQFMNSLGAIYRHYTSFLLSRNQGYQGLAYRIAASKFSQSTYPDRFHKMIFCGFNALNAAEVKIFGSLHRQNKADLLWDADPYYLNNHVQEAGMFLRNNFIQFAEKESFFIKEHFKDNKSIRVVSVPKQLGQAQVVKQTLQGFIDRGIPLDTVAVVLANEKLLWPVLQQLPAAVEFVNITMEYPLRYTTTYSLLEILINIQLSFSKQTRKEKTIYHRDLTNLLRQSLFRNYLGVTAPGIKTGLVTANITSRNISFITPSNLRQLFGEDFPLIADLLQAAPSVHSFCDTLLQVISSIIAQFSATSNRNHESLELEYLHVILKHFNRLKEILLQYEHFSTMSAFRQLFQQVVGNASAPFIGEPLRGLQVMGVLETRTLDFDHVVFVNVNEGVLPSGKTINSFIPNDLKRAFGMPLYIEKDAIYAYHFYRILQRAKEVVITYDSETDAFGKGEKSRFVTQLQLEMQKYNPGISLTEEVASYAQMPPALRNNIVIHKEEKVISPILLKATSEELYGGLSPSGLITYKECPLKFYFRYSARLKEAEEVEESAEANTFGSILHLSLETLYAGFLGRIISTEELKKRSGDADKVVNTSFASFFGGNPPAGKSLLQQEVIKVYVNKLLNNDLKFIDGLNNKGHHLSLKGLEEELSAPLNVIINEEDKTIYIKGKIDRVDAYEGTYRIIDYKSSVKDSDKFVFTGYENLFTDNNYNKQLQLFLYAWLVFKNNRCQPEQIKPCIIPFKVFAEEPKFILGADKKPLPFNAALFNQFESELRLYVESIFSKGSTFMQTSDEKIHEYCPYNKICNFR